MSDNERDLIVHVHGHSLFGDVTVRAKRATDWAGLDRIRPHPPRKPRRSPCSGTPQASVRLP